MILQTRPTMYSFLDQKCLKVLCKYNMIVKTHRVHRKIKGDNPHGTEKCKVSRDYY
jgi:hypothetical protein